MDNILKIKIEEQLANIYNIFLNTKPQVYLLRTNNREKVYNYFLEKTKANFADSQENFTLNLQVFDINKARELIKFLETDYLSLHLVIISLYSINEATQNALLKSLEDIPRNIKIILIVDTDTRLLTTILSRVYRLDNLILNNLELSLDNLKELAKQFLKTNKLSRMNLKEIKELLEKKDEYAKEIDVKDRADREILEKFFTEIQKLLLTKIEEDFNQNKEETKIFFEYLDHIMEAIKYIKLSSSSGKTILEYLSLKLPVIN